MSCKQLNTGCANPSPVRMGGYHGMANLRGIWDLYLGHIGVISATRGIKGYQMGSILGVF